jgi:hypothetical protein
MIQLIEAPPRSGKSYFAVNYAVKFTKYDSLYHEYILDADTLIISNIEGLKINHWDLVECLKKKTMEEFFSIKNFEDIQAKTKKNRIILMIDECHDFFPAGFVSHPIYSFFAYHGHIGLDIILMCQSLERTSRMFNPLLEYVVKVTPRSRAVFNNFSYSFVDLKGRWLYSKTLRKDKMVFNAYKSFRKDEHSKPKNALKQWAVVCLMLFVGAGFLFKTALGIVKGKSEKGKVAADVVQKRLSPAPVPPAPPAPAPLSSLPPVPPGAVAAASNTFPRISSSRSVPPSVASVPSATVKGFISRGKMRQYLLSDGSIVSSQRNFVTGQTFIR